MSLRKNLQDALNEAHYSKFDVAKKILAEHINKQGFFEKDLSDLANHLRGYKNALVKAYAIVDSAKLPGPAEQQAHKDAIREAMAHLDQCRKVAERLSHSLGEE
jgi:hypothetical protein